MADQEYPHIIRCRACGTRTVPVPLEHYPLPAARLVEVLQAPERQWCGECASTGLVLDQSPEAHAWYDATQRKTDAAQGRKKAASMPSVTVWNRDMLHDAIMPLQRTERAWNCGRLTSPPTKDTAMNATDIDDDTPTYTSPYADRLNVSPLRGYEIDELACHVCGIPDTEDDPDLDDALYALFGIDQVTYHKIINVHLAMANVGQSPVTGRVYRCSGPDGIALVKEEIERQSPSSEPNEGSAAGDGAGSDPVDGAGISDEAMSAVTDLVAEVLSIIGPAPEAGDRYWWKSARDLLLAGAGENGTAADGVAWWERQVRAVHQDPGCLRAVFEDAAARCDAGGQLRAAVDQIAHVGDKILAAHLSNVDECLEAYAQRSAR